VLLSIVLLLASGCKSDSQPSQAARTSATPTGTSSPAGGCPNPHGGTCLGPLGAGTYTTTLFLPTLTYRVASGWANYEDLHGNFLLLPPGQALEGVDAGTSDYISVFTQIAAQEPDCSGPSPESSPTAIAATIAGRPELKVTKPRQASVGGLDGVVLDIALAEDASPTCLIVGVPPSEFDHGVIPGLKIRLYLLRHEGTLAIEVDDVSGGKNLDSYSRVVEQFQFGG
jgi:hypothetical protein